MPRGFDTQNKSAIISNNSNNNSEDTPETHHHFKTSSLHKAPLTSATIPSSTTDRSKHAPTAEQRTKGQQQQRFDISVRSSSASSMSGTGSGSLTAITTGETSNTYEGVPNCFTRRHGRRYLRDSTLPYPLPCDIAELNRQNLRTRLFCEVFRGPICSPLYKDGPPKKILDLACGTGYWSALCHQHYTKRGHPPVSFTGFDIAPVAPDLGKEFGMNWTFVQGDFRKKFPFPDNEFDFVLGKEGGAAIPLATVKQHIIDEVLRVLKPGGTLELWEADTAVRMLLPHMPNVKGEEEELQEIANATSTYIITTQTPFALPQNQYLLDFNNWMTKVFEARKVTPLPCTIVRSDVLQEAESLQDTGFRRLAIPFSEVRWEREGVGGYVKLGPDGQARISAKGKAKEENKKVLTAGQAALRRTALQTVVQMIESLEPLLKEVSGKGQDEWDRWWGNMMNDLMKNNGTSWGECLEIGAWWSRKRMHSS